VKLNSPLKKRKRDSTPHKINGTNVKRKKINVIETFLPIPTPVEINSSLPRLKTTQEIFLEMQMNESTVNTILQKKIIDESLHETVKLDYSDLHNTDANSLHTQKQLTCNGSDLTTICASFNTVADLIEDHRRRIFAEYDSLEIEAKPDLLLVPLDRLAFVYEREKLRQINPSSHSQSSSMTTVDKLNPSSDFLALPFIDCPMEFDLVLDELIVQQPIIDM